MDRYIPDMKSCCRRRLLARKGAPTPLGALEVGETSVWISGVRTEP